MKLKEIYRPIEKELFDVNELLRKSLLSTKHKSILKISNYLLDVEGKRLRPALVLFSAKASQGKSSINHHAMISTAAAVELIHIASLIHDDVIDRANLRHNKPTINSKFGQDVSIALGDYLYSVGFELISQCGSTEILQSISSATKAMCEGEFVQVCERDNLDLLKEQYIGIVKKKTASLFAASCRSGTLIVNSHKYLQNALEGYALNLGIAFQIIDDYLDLVGEDRQLGKTTGQDIEAGEITLPLLNLLESVSLGEREEIKKLLALKKKGDSLKRLKSKLFNYGAIDKTKNTVLTYVASAKDRLNGLSDSPYKEGLYALADFVVERGFNDKS